MFTKGNVSKKGSAVVEAAIFLPVFFLALLSIVLLIRLITVDGAIMEIYTKEAAIVAKEAYLSEVPVMPDGIETKIAGGLTHGTVMTLRIREKAENKEKLPLSNIRMQSFLYLFESRGTDSLIRSDLVYESNIPLPAGFGRTLNFRRVFLFRAFVGSTGQLDPMDFSEMEKNEKSKSVYVFPRAGQRYHKKNCSVIVVYPIETYLTKSLHKKYEPCKLCHPNERAWGSKVYYFPKDGLVYHRENCPLVERYIVEMDEQEAIEKGYSACKMCGG